jgi:hypothetical protein
MNESYPRGATHMKRTITLRNRRDTDLVVVLEPWANEYLVQPDQTLEVVEEGGELGTILEIDIETSHLVFYARPGSILRACRDGEELP